MSVRFFELADDLHVPHRWYLATPTDSQDRKVFDWDFKRGAPVHVPEGRLKIPIKIAGMPPGLIRGPEPQRAEGE